MSAPHDPWLAGPPPAPPAGARWLTGAEATREALALALARDPAVFVMGQDVDAAPAMFGTTRDLARDFGPARCFDTPLAENAMMGVAIGAALEGMRPIYLHNRPDFLLLAADQLLNHAAKLRYTFGGRVHVPLVVWACTGRGWGGASQHSQALHGLFWHVPGLKLALPATPADARGLMLAAIADPDPVLILEHRANLGRRGPVPEGDAPVPLGQGVVRRPGRDLTLVAVADMVHEALLAADQLAGEGVEAEVVDPRSLVPLDRDLLLASARRTGRVVVCDGGWKTGGVSAELSALLAEEAWADLRAPLLRVAAPDLPHPAAEPLERAFYPGCAAIVATARRCLECSR
jgi:pyruvate dehydrogenase E1 component beta subunit